MTVYQAIQLQILEDSSFYSHRGGNTKEHIIFLSVVKGKIDTANKIEDTKTPYT
jgi:hypothetical protein